MTSSEKLVSPRSSKRDKQSDVMECENPSPDWWLWLIFSPILTQGALQTDLHGFLHVFHGSVEGYLEHFAHFFGESLEPCPREPVWEVLYCPYIF